MPQTTEFPLPVAIWCPRCGARHIDVGEWATIEKAHHKHLCHCCGNVWDACLWGAPEEGPRGGLTRHERHYPTVGVSDQRIIQLARASLRSCLSGIEVMRKPGGRVTDSLIGEATTIEGLCWTVENHDDGASNLGEKWEHAQIELGKAYRRAIEIGGAVKIDVLEPGECACDPLDDEWSAECPKHVTMELIDIQRREAEATLEKIRAAERALSSHNDTGPSAIKQMIWLQDNYEMRIAVIGKMLATYRKVRGL